MNVSKIRDFSDLIGYSFFDEEGHGKISKAARWIVFGIFVYVGAIHSSDYGGGISGVLKSAAIGAAIFGMLSLPSLIKRKIFRKKPRDSSIKLGLKIKTKDCDASAPFLVMDFVGIMQPPSKLDKFADCELEVLPLESDFF
ncbi:MAG: hypothetical protein LBS21_12270 [Clostridiales bacterium]|jgi:hypothetical protein|nr:hypothetical protein [Clostridiales bacterium]